MLTMSLQSEDEEPLPEVYSFGRGGIERGYAGTQEQLSPRLVDSLADKRIVDIANGYQHTLALTVDGTVYAFGYGSHGELGTGNTENQAVPVPIDVPGLTAGDRVKAVAAGQYTSFLLTVSGEVYAFGDHTYGQLGIGTISGTKMATPTWVPVTEPIAAVSAGTNHTLLLAASGNVYAFGRDWEGQTGLDLQGDSVYTDATNAPTLITQGLPSGVKATAISAGGSHSLVVMEDGTLYSFPGGPASGRYDDSSLPQIPRIVDPAVFGNRKIVKAVAGTNHSLVLTEDGIVYTFGFGFDGQLGNEPLYDGIRYDPVAIPQSSFGGERVAQLAAGDFFSMALTESRKLYTFGREENIGQGETGNAAAPKLLDIVGVIIKKIDAGTSDGFVLTEGPSSIDVPDAPTGVAVTPGNGRIDVSFTPPAYDGNSAITGYTVYARAGATVVSAQAAGSPIGLAGLTNGIPYQVTVTATNIKGESAPSVPLLGVTPQLPAVRGYGAFSFGDNGGGQLGPHASDDNAANAALGITELPSDIAGAAAGDTHTLVLTASGAVYAFGSGDRGQLGLGSGTLVAASPTKLTALTDEVVTAVAAGPRHSLLLTASGAVYTFGYGAFGELGHGDEQSRSLPTRVEGLAGKRVASIAAGDNFSLALTVQHEVYFFGLRHVPELGYIAEQPSPVRIEGGWAADQRPIAIAAGSVHMLVLTDKGYVYSFGLGSAGQLGQGNNELNAVPTRIAGLPSGDRAVAIAAGGTNSLVLTESGAVYGFGGNADGQLGLGDRTGRNTPTVLTALAGKRAVAAAMGQQHSLVAVEAGRAYAVYTFGEGENGQLGTGNGEGRLTPVPVSAFAGKKVLALAAGDRHSVVVANDAGADTSGPTIAGATVGAGNAYVDVEFNEGIYRTPAGAGGLFPGHWVLGFAQNGGNATEAAILDVRKPDGETAETASPLTGGEMTVRVFLSVGGTPSGTETVSLRPVNGLAVFDAAGNAMASSLTTGALQLKDMVAPTIVSVVRGDDTHITVTLSENAVCLDNPHDGGFAVSETGGSAAYEVTSTAIGVDAKHIVLTVADMGESGKEGVTVGYIAGGHGAVADTVGNALATVAPYAAIAGWDTAAPAFTDARRISDTQVEVSLSEDIAIGNAQANDGGFIVKETDNTAISYAVTTIAQGSDAKYVVLTVADLGVSAKEGITIGYSATGNGKLADKAGNTVATTATVKDLAAWDTTAPTITWGSLSADNAYIDITVSEGVYSSALGTGAPGANHITITSPTGGNATSVTIQALARPDGTTPATASPLTGGETAIRVFLSTDKPPSGTESVTVKLPSFIYFMYDRAGNAAVANPAQQTYTMKDRLAPSVLSASRGTNASTQIIVQLSEGVPDAEMTKNNDGGFAVVETGSGGTVVYQVRSIAKGANARQVVLTVDNFARSGGKGITVLYTKGGNGTVKDAAGNEMVGGSAAIAAWDQGPSLSSADNIGNLYVDIQFSEGVYGLATGTGALDESFFELTLSNADGTLANASIAAVKRTNGEEADTASPLAGGETTVRLFLTLDGEANGYETMVISVVKPIYDEFGNASDGMLLTSDMYFYDLYTPKIVSAERENDRTIRLNFNEYIGIMDEQWNFYDDYTDSVGFIVEQTVSDEPAISSISGGRLLGGFSEFDRVPKLGP